MNFCDEKEIDEAAEAVIEKIARKLSNDILFGMNRKETNADSIRTMNDEELAKYFSYIVDCDNCPNELDRECCVHEDACINKWLKWLKQPYNEEGET